MYCVILISGAEIMKSKKIKKRRVSKSEYFINISVTLVLVLFGVFFLFVICQVYDKSLVLSSNNMSDASLHDLSLIVAICGS